MSDLGSVLGTPGFVAAQENVLFTMQRQKLLADNIANVDTPGYQRKDLDVSAFRQELRDSIERAQNPSERESLSSEYPERTGPNYTMFHDDNNRSVEHLMLDLTRNRQQLTAAVNMMRSQMRMLRSILGTSGGR